MRLLKNKYLAISLILFLTVYGCKKIIDVNLRDAAIQIVITGEVTNHPGPYNVNISKTASFNSDNDFPAVSGAVVTITGNGVTDSLRETSPGIYATHILHGKPGKSYSLYVSVEGKEYTATSVMPQPVQLDSIDFRTGRKQSKACEEQYHFFHM